MNYRTPITEIQQLSRFCYIWFISNFFFKKKLSMLYSKSQILCHSLLLPTYLYTSLKNMDIFSHKHSPVIKHNKINNNLIIILMLSSTKSIIKFPQLSLTKKSNFTVDLFKSGSKECPCGIWLSCLLSHSSSRAFPLFYFMLLICCKKLVWLSCSTFHLLYLFSSMWHCPFNETRPVILECLFSHGVI